MWSNEDMGRMRAAGKPGSPHPPHIRNGLKEHLPIPASDCFQIFSGRESFHEAHHQNPHVHVNYLDIQYDDIYHGNFA